MVVIRCAAQRKDAFMKLDVTLITSNDYQLL